MGEADLVIAITAAALAAGALIFAVVQTMSALSQFLASSNRCGRRITGAFDLRAGIWFSPNTMTANPRYRMPVLTMAALRRRPPMMEPDRSYTTDFRPGRNFEENLNCYVDKKRSRILGPGAPGYKALHKPKTILHYLVAILWAPAGAALTLVMWVSCCPCFVWMALHEGLEAICDKEEMVPEDDSGCGCDNLCSSKSCIQFGLVPLLWSFKKPKHFKDLTGVDARIAESRTPGLEAGCWVQFLMNHQRTWWGYADLRWEWRLASLIPTDVYGASMETTVADLQLIAALTGMSFSGDSYTLATARCGEQINFSQHGSLGCIAYYRSTRENIRSRITVEAPKYSSCWLYRCIEACRNGQSDSFALTQRYSGTKFDGPPTVTNLSAIISQLSRHRTEFDAQLPYSCGSAMWVFASKGFRAALNDICDISTKPWAHCIIGAVWGPLGEGLNSCSCVRCCDEWERTTLANSFSPSLRPDALQWPALELGSREVYEARKAETPPLAGCGRLWEKFKNNPALIGGARVKVETLPLCRKRCGPQSRRCGQISRLVNFSADEPNDHEVLVVVAINTKWLGGIDRVTLTKAAEALLLLDGQQHTDNIKSIVTVMAYTEYSLLQVRRKIGSTNIWNAPPSPDLTDFFPLVFGS